MLLAYVNSSLVTANIKKLDEVYRLIDPLIVNREKYYEYLDMTLNFESVSKVYTIT